MDAINPTTIPTTVTAEEVLQHLHDFTESASRTKMRTVQDSMSADVTQYLALGLVSLQEVFASARKLAMIENKYERGSMFDIFTIKGLEYAAHTISVAQGITPDYTVTQNDTFGAKHILVRQQLQIESDLLTDESGNSYFEVRRRQIMAGAKPFEWSYYTTIGTSKVNDKHRLYVTSLDDHMFYIVTSNGVVDVALGNPVVWDATNANIRKAGVAVRYEQLLNATPREIKLAWARQDNGQEILFWNIFKMLKAEATSAPADVVDEVVIPELVN
jgi:hypothetical protein